MILRRLLSGIAKEIEDVCPEFVGHIKGICTGGGGNYLRAGYVSAASGVAVSGVWNREHGEINLVLNVIAFGVPAGIVPGIVTKAVCETGHGLNILIMRENADTQGAI
jgi:hypothetical protein